MSRSVARALPTPILSPIRRRDCGSFAAQTLTNRAIGALWSVRYLVPTSFRLRLYFAWIAAGKRIYGYGGATQRLPGGLYIKYGPGVAKGEADATEYVRKHTTIPVPRILDFISYDDSLGKSGLMLMTAVPGVPLGKAFGAEGPDSATIAEMRGDLADWLAQLHSLQRPNSNPPFEISGFEGSLCWDFRLSIFGKSGPFKTLADFDEYILDRIKVAEARPLIESAQTKLHSRRRRICLTHGDISLGNLLVENGRLSGLVDWECAGWYPDYWEFTKAAYSRRHGQEKWFELIGPIFFESFATELALEALCWISEC